MGIRENSKKIVRYLLEEAIKSGNLKHETLIKDSDLAKKLEFDSEEFLVVCIQYLKEKGFITSDKGPEKRSLAALPGAVDFLEQG